MKTCSRCGSILDLADDPGPCPLGGPHNVLIQVREDIGFREQQWEVDARGDGTQGYRRNAWDGRSLAADVTPDGATRSVTDTAPHGESDTPLVGQVLAQHLSRDGERWDSLYLEATGREEHGVDCKLTESTTGQTLYLQVTRIADSEFWKDLRRHGTAARQATVTEAADRLAAAIRRKARADIRGITLAINAMQTPEFSFGAIVDAVAARPELKTLGFDAIWVVGPKAEYCRRLV